VNTLSLVFFFLLNLILCQTYKFNVINRIKWLWDSQANLLCWISMWKADHSRKSLMYNIANWYSFITRVKVNKFTFFCRLLRSYCLAISNVRNIKINSSWWETPLMNINKHLVYPSELFSHYCSSFFLLLLLHFSVYC